MSTLRFGLAPLSLLGTEPADLVATAAAAGFDFVGLRIIPVTDREPDLNLLPGSPRLAATRTALEHTGVLVVDVEFLALDGTLGRETWLPVLEAAATLKAKSLTAAGCDPERNRLTDTLVELSGDCQDHGIHLNLEPISYQPVHSIPDAAALAEQADCGWLPDTLHVNRFGGTSSQIREHARRVSMLQLCDGPAIAPTTRDGLVEESRSRRLVPGSGDFDLASAVDAVSPDVDLSAEVPDPVTRERMGDLAWARQLLEAMRSVAREAGIDVG